MRKLSLFILPLIFVLLSSSAMAFHYRPKDARKNEANYIHNVHKQDEKEKYEKRILNYIPSGYMTVQEYEALSEYKDKSEQKVENQTVRQSDDMYVPKPVYHVVRYNDPPGTPELNIPKSFYKLRQYNGSGVAAPDYSIMAYPVIYYYPITDSTAADIFVIPLGDGGSPVEKLLTANIKRRQPVPIVSTEKSIDNDAAFRSLTPVDFSVDSKKILIKEKIGSSQDGIWKTNAIVYDFNTKTAYNLIEVRDAIIYYWKETKNINLDDYRWDIYPLGFLKDDSDRVAIYAYAYTGEAPVFLGIWSVDIHGEQSRLLSFDIDNIELSVNGFKLINEGVVNKGFVEREQKVLKNNDKKDAKKAKKLKKEVYKVMKKEYRGKMKELDLEFNDKTKDYNLLQKVEGTTSLNDIPVEYKKLKIEELKKEIAKQEKSLVKQQKKIEELDKKLNKAK